MFKKAIEYLEYNFQLSIQGNEWQGISNLPIFLSKGYDFKELLINDTVILMINCSRKEDLGVEVIISNLVEIRDKGKFTGETILLFKNITNYHREKLIKAGQAFIISGKQIYAPFLGLIFIEKSQDRFIVNEVAKAQVMKPTTQALFLELISTSNFDRSAQELSNKLNVTKMSITRAFKDLEEMNIVSKSYDYYLSDYRFVKNIKETWENAYDYIMDPVVQRIYVNASLIDDLFKNDLITSGESALSKYTMLGQPQQKTYGISRKRFKKFEEQVEVQPYAESNSYMIEIWRHEMPSVEGAIHPFAVAAEMKNNYDERIEDQTKHMLQQFFDKEK